MATVLLAGLTRRQAVAMRFATMSLGSPSRERVLPEVSGEFKSMWTITQMQKQITLRTLAVWVLVVSIGIAFRFQLTELVHRWVIAKACVALIASFLVARYLQRPRSRVWLVLSVPLILFALYACFTVYRLQVAFEGSGQFLLDFPYPDSIVLQLEQWFRTPPEDVPPGSIDFHGGFMETRAIINWTALITAGLAGWSVGRSVGHGLFYAGEESDA